MDNVWYLATDFLCKKQKVEVNYYEKHYVLITVLALSGITLSYNFYNYFKLKTKYEELKKAKSDHEILQNVYNSLVNITEYSDSDNSSDNNSDNSSDNEDESDMVDIDLKK